MERLAFFATFAAERGLLFDDRTPNDFSVYSPDMAYRYAFARWWATDGPLVLWVGVNPGKGDTEQRRRPTLARCVNWSQRWGAAGLMFANLFAARHNTPDGLRDMADPVGPHNDAALAAMSAVAGRTIAAWGNDGQRRDRPAAVVGLLTDPHCLGVTVSGQPRHPLYVAGSASVVRWPVVRAGA